MGRTLAMSASGRFVALREGTQIAVIDVQGTAPRRLFAGGVDFAIAGTTLVIVDVGGIRTEPLEGTRAGATLAIAGARVSPFWGRMATAVMIDETLVTLEPKLVATGELRGFPLHGRAVLVADRDRLAIATSGRNSALATVEGAVREAVPLFGGRSIAVIVEQAGVESVVVIQHNAVIHRLRLGTPRWRAFAPERGLLLIGSGDAVVVTIDLRMGRIAAQGLAPHDVTALAIDEDGRTIALHGPDARASVMRLDALGKIAEVDVELEVEQEPPAAVTSTTVAPPPAWHAPSDEPAVAIAIPELLPLALGTPRQRTTERKPVDGTPYTDPNVHLAALLDLVAARAGVAIAEGWHSGRISADASGHHPFEREVRALAGANGSHAPEQLADSHRLLVERAAGVAERVHATLAVGLTLPFIELGREYRLSPTALQVLISVIAPHARGEIARMYRILGNETQRPTCDDTLVALLVGGRDGEPRDRIIDELAEHAPLVRHGLVLRDGRGGLDVDPILVARLRGQIVMSRAVLREASTALEELVIDRAVVREAVLELAEPRAEHAPVRVVVRGRRGSGRHALIAALAARLERPIACIDASQFPIGQLARELVRASLARAVPVVSNIELREGDGRETQQLVHQILRDHPGPLAIRTGVDGSVPLDPGFVELVLPTLSESARGDVFRAALAAAAIDADGFALARRYRVGPGTIHQIVDEAHHRITRTAADPREHDALVDECARQHLASRIGATAQRVTRLADWDQVSLPDEMLDSLRELIGRARHARTVFDDWGYDDKIATARGLTALFYGPPGTGKTMVAGLIARELGLELYRVDLAKVMSKWIGETEKHLGELFDAAEDGRIMLLFDEADSLFAKRSEVKSSNDRYANLEVNYLLQRLDAFEGVAVLTTNLDGSIDPAFKRRLSMRLLFPFPDEEQRAQLWAAHVTSRIPTRGVLDFAALARRFPLSGGYIRNSALRAAFLAAQDGSPLTQQHLERAVLLEYRELGKLADDGRVD